MLKKNLNLLINKIFIIFKSKPGVINLGRWNIETCHKRINKKIDFANEDHCGPCGNKYLKFNK